MAAQPPEGSPQEEASESPQQESQEQQGGQGAQGGQPGIGDIIVALGNGMQKLFAIMQKAGVPKQVLGYMQGSIDQYEQAVSMLGGKGGGQQPADSGSATMEQGGSSQAVPSY